MENIAIGIIAIGFLGFFTACYISVFQKESD